MLGANHLLHVFGVGFHLYNQLKKSPHNGTGVLGRSTILMASQTTRLGKGSSVMMWDECASLRFYYSETNLEWILKNFIIISFGYLSFPSSIPPFLSSLCYLIISPVPTCLVHNCETSWWKEQKRFLLWQAREKSSDSSQLYAKGFVERRRKWRY